MYFVKKEWIMLIASVAITLVLAIGSIRLFVPQLLGIPVDLQMVKVDEKIPPFFDSVFRIKDYKSDNFIIKDPYIMRARPRNPDQGMLGPHDIIGFRNRRIPNVADIITIGDSQTYGNNAVLEKNWPNQMTLYLANKSPVLYNMSVGGWCAVEYLEIFYKSIVFHPRVVIVAFYTGNDPLESFLRVYGNQRWAFLRPNPDISAVDAPKMKFPPPKSDYYLVKFNDGMSMYFTPRLRHASNKTHPAIHAGYNIMAQVARRISKSASELNIKIVFTIIPTKELVYAGKIKKDGIIPPDDYLNLIKDEKFFLINFSKNLKQISNTVYVDILNPLQKAALKSIPLYPMTDGHPLQKGYDIIAKTIANAVKNLIPEKAQGGVLVKYDLNQKDKLRMEQNITLKTKQDSQFFYQIFLIRNNCLFRFASYQIMIENGWDMQMLHIISPRDIANIPYGPVIKIADRKRYGPIQ